MTDYNVKIDGEILIVERGGMKYSSSNLAGRIRDYIKFEDKVVVRLDIPTSVIYNENIMAFNLKGEQLWQIEAIPHIYENSPYTRMVMRQGKLHAFNWDGEEVIVDQEDGAITKRIEGR